MERSYFLQIFVGVHALKIWSWEKPFTSFTQNSYLQEEAV
jgi:hypothetical protein